MCHEASRGKASCNPNINQVYVNTSSRPILFGLMGIQTALGRGMSSTNKHKQPTLVLRNIFQSVRRHHRASNATAGTRPATLSTVRFTVNRHSKRGAKITPERISSFNTLVRCYLQGSDVVVTPTLAGSPTLFLSAPKSYRALTPHEEERLHSLGGSTGLLNQHISITLVSDEGCFH